MNKLYYLVALCSAILFSANHVWADYQLPNSGFEQWEYDALNQYEDGQRPVNWNTSNIKKTVIGITAGANMVFPDGNSHSGAYCAKAINTEVGAAGVTETSPAWLTLGKPWSWISGIETSSATAGTDGGLEFTHRPDTVQLWIKRTSSGNEWAHIVFYSWKGTSRGDSYKNKGGKCSSTTHYDEESDIRLQYDANECGTAVKATQVAEAHWKSTEQFKDWTLIKVPINYLVNDLPEKCNMIISAANYPNKRATEVEENATLWADDIQLIYSSKVHEIKIVRPGETIERPIAGVAPEITEYTYSLGLGATAADIPEIRCYRSGRMLNANECKITYANELDKPSTITIYAEDGSSSTTYQVTFAAKKSDNAKPASITLDGELLVGFSAYRMSYDVTLPYGTTQCPVVEVVTSEDGQTYTVSEGKVPGSVTVIVTAPDGVSKLTYTINFTVAQLSDNTLADILLNGTSITGFSPTKTKYKVELPLGTTETPVIKPVSAYAEGEQTITIVEGGLDGTTTITVTPPTGTSRTYSISYVITESSYSLLKDIKVGGVTLDGFDPEVKSYSYALPLGTNTLPEITYTPGDAYQKVDMVTGGMNGVTTITVTAQNGTKSIYRITFSAQKSTVSTLKDILLDGVSLQGFVATTTAYNVKLPQGGSAPKVTYVKGDDYQEVSLTEGGLTGTTRIVVVAQDGSVTTYTLTFEVDKSANTHLLGISLDNIPLEGFASDKLTYDIELPRGTSTLPSITWIAADAFQTIRVVEGGVNGETKITVKAQTGTVAVYVLKFHVQTNSNVNLNDIKVNGVSIEGFVASKLDYTMTLPAGTTTFPTITWTKADDAQEVVLTKGGLNGTTLLLVKAEDGTTRTYTITFSVMKSENAFLKMIYVDGTPLADFQPSTLNYDYILTKAVTQCPEISVDKEQGQNVSIAVPKLTGLVRIEVTPESGDKNVYTININYPRSSNSKLKSILLNGSLIEGWDANTTDYTIILPASTTVIPVITYVAGEDKQTVIQETNAITGDTKLIVKAENGDITTYQVVFKKEKSSNALLKNILLNGTAIAGFNPQTLHYNYILAEDATTAPAITYVKGDNRQHVTLTSPAVEGEAQLMVVAEDASDTTTYTITMAFVPSEDNSLERIILTQRAVGYDSVLTMAHFATSDTVTIDWIADIAAPTATYVAGDDRQMVALADAGLNGTEILVVAENGSQRKYVIRYNIVRTNIAMLNDLQIYDAETEAFVDIPDFASDKLNYTLELPWRTKVVPVLHPVPMFKGQRIEMNYGTVDGPTTIVVTAEDGITTKTYTVNFNVKKSSVATLNAIYFDHDNLQEIPGFTPTTYDYTILLPYGTKDAPLLTWDLGEENGSTLTEQIVMYEAGNLYTPATIKVTAEDGTTKTYTIRYKVEGSGKDNVLSIINVGDVPVVIEEGVYDYVVNLPYGTTEIPTIDVIKAFPEQSTFITSKGILGGTRIVVFSNDGVANRTVYNLTYRVAEQPALLTAIKIDGVELPIFDPRETSYIWNVETIPTTVEAVAATGASILEETIDQNKAKVVVKRDEQEVTYWVHFYYPQHIIPNADFSQWEGTKYNGAQKPVGWMVPAQVAEKLYFDAWVYSGTYYTGSEVLPSGDAVLLSSIYDAIPYGTIPGMMTIGTMSMNLKEFNGTTSSVSGGIPFYNTPNRILVDYQPLSTEFIDNWRMLLKINDSEEHLYEGSFDGIGVWQVASKDIDTKIEKFTQINLTLNSANSENAKSIKGSSASTKEPESKLYVRNPRFWYNNLLAAISVNNAPLDGFNPNVFEYTYTLEAENVVLPKIEMTGQVQDQQHRIVWSDEVNGERTATITVTAEDGTTQDYLVKFIRSASSNKQLKSIKVNGVSLSDFASDKYEYSYTLPNMTRTMPNVEVEGMNYNQTITYAFEGNQKFLITVKAENGDEQVYTIHIVEAKDEVTALLSLSVDEHTIAYDASVKEYNVDMTVDAVAPYIFFKKASEGQQVQLAVDNDKAVLTVTAQNGTSKSAYTIHFVRPSVPSTAQLTSLSINGYAVDGFAPDRYTYAHDMELEPSLFLHYTSQLPSDRITHVITADSVLLIVTNTAGQRNIYHVDCAGNLSADATLESLTYDYRSITGFAPALMDYPVETPRLAYPHVGAKAYHAQTTMTVDYYVSAANERVFTFNTRSKDGTQKATLVRLVTPKEISTALQAILLNNMPLRENGEGYTSSSVYQPEVKDYTIRLHSASPKMTQPTMPDISVVAGTYGQKVSVETGDIDGTTYITVLSEAGDETTYTLNFEPERSSNVRLDNLFVNYETIEGFQPKRYFYEIDLPQGSEFPNISWQEADAFQRVESKFNDNRIEVKVTAEDGSSEIYQIDINWLPSNETHIESILSNGLPLDGFQSDIYDYFIVLPVGTPTEPMLKIVAGAEGQSITIKNGGVNGVTTITVVAPDGVSTRDYRLHYSLQMSENNKLDMIFLNGTPLAGFTPDVRDYDVALSMEEPNPAVTWETADDYQTVTRTIRPDGTVVLTVVPQRAELKYEYIVRFSRAASKNAYLRSIEVDGAVIEGFAADKYNYVISLPVGTTTVPYISYTLSESWQKVDYTEAPTLEDEAIIKVFAQDSTYTSIYHISFNVQLSSVDTLKGIYVGGPLVDGFAADKTDYQITLPHGVTTLPAITCEPGDAYQTVEVITSKMAYTVVVTAQNGQRKIYSVTFENEKSGNTTLVAIYKDGEVIEGFDPDITHYEIALPYGTTNLPRIAYEKAETAQTVTVTPATTLAETTYITVTAENGMTLTYSLSYAVQLSDNAFLKAIYLDGTLLERASKTFTTTKDFAADDMEYFITLPVHSQTLPEVTYEAQVAESAVTVEVIDNSTTDNASGVVVIRVVAQDGRDENEYTIHFSTRQSDNVTLSDLLVNGKSIEGFSPKVTEYVLSFPVGSDTTLFPTKEQVEVVLAESGQTYIIYQDQPELIVIQVTAADGVTTGSYVIASEIKLSDNAYLSNLTIQGNTVLDWDSTRFEYTYLLPYEGGEISVDWIGYVKGDEYQEVLMTTTGNVVDGDAAINIFVTAQDGTEQIYTIYFVQTTDDPSNYPSPNDVCLVKVGDGRWKATSIRANVQVFLYNIAGHRLAYGTIPVIDPNDKDFMCDESSSTIGLEFSLPKKQDVYVFSFVYGKKIIRSNKVTN